MLISHLDPTSTENVQTDLKIIPNPGFRGIGGWGVRQPGNRFGSFVRAMRSCVCAGGDDVPAAGFATVNNPLRAWMRALALCCGA